MAIELMFDGYESPKMMFPKGSPNTIHAQILAKRRSKTLHLSKQSLKAVSQREVLCSSRGTFPMLSRHPSF